MTTTLKPSRHIPDTGRCVHCDAPLFEGGPVTASEFPLTCECGYSNSLMDLGFYDSTEDDKDVAVELEVSEARTKLSQVTEAIEAAEDIVLELTAEGELAKSEAEMVTKRMMATAEESSKRIIERAETLAAELLTRATTGRALESEKDPANDSENENQAEGRPPQAESDSVSGEQPRGAGEC